MKRQFRTNLSDKNLFCLYSKERIKVGEKYCIVFETYFGELIKKTYKLEYLECLDEEE